MSLFEDGDGEALAIGRIPGKMIAVLNLLTRTGAAVEPTFSIVKYQRTPHQDRLDDHGLWRKLTLRDFYEKNKPCDVLLECTGP